MVPRQPPLPELQTGSGGGGGGEGREAPTGVFQAVQETTCPPPPIHTHTQHFTCCVAYGPNFWLQNSKGAGKNVSRFLEKFLQKCKRCFTLCPFTRKPVVGITSHGIESGPKCPNCCLIFIVYHHIYCLVLR